MRSQVATKIWTVAVAGLVGLMLLAAPALAQYGGLRSNTPGNRNNALTKRYDEATKGANLQEWIVRLRDEDPMVRLEAVKSIGESGDPEGVDYLMQAAGDADQRVRAKAIDFLGETQATEATLFLIQRLFMNGTHEGLRHRILMALGKIGDPRASRPIIEFVSREDVPADVRGTGIFALGEIGNPVIVQDLRRLRETESNPRLVSLIDEALTKIEARKTAEVHQTGRYPSALEAALRREGEEQQPR